MKVRLTTRDGRELADVEIPPFQYLPEVLIYIRDSNRSVPSTVTVGCREAYYEPIPSNLPDNCCSDNGA
jgi:hypothetical protein